MVVFGGCIFSSNPTSSPGVVNLTFGGRVENGVSNCSFKKEVKLNMQKQQTGVSVIQLLVFKDFFL